MSNKTLKIDPSLFSLNKKEKKDKKANKTEKSILRNELTNSNRVKKEMLKRVKDYQKKKEIEKISNEKSENNENNNFEDNDFEKEFNKSLNFLGNLAKKNKMKKNKTEKIKDNVEVNLNISNDLNSEPSYGCLKNGNKPTYNELNKTRKNDQRIKIVLENNTYDGNKEDIVINVNTDKDELNTKKDEITNSDIISSDTINIDTINSDIINSDTINSDIKNSDTLNSDTIKEEIEYNINNFDNNKDYNFINNINNRKDEIIHLENENNNLNIPKINRLTRKKKFLLGKNKKKNKIGILLKNKQTQKNIKEEIALIKKKNIMDIKNYLSEKNLIKKGSEAPNDVLRKLYEDSILSGNINNLNNDNLVFNYLLT